LVDFNNARNDSNAINVLNVQNVPNALNEQTNPSNQTSSRRTVFSARTLAQRMPPPRWKKRLSLQPCRHQKLRHDHQSQLNGKANFIFHFASPIGQFVDD
jgi:hypothetical protein